MSIGPGTLSEILRKTVQALIDASLNPKQTFSVLRTRQGDGDVVVHGKKQTLMPRILSMFLFLLLI